MILEWYELKEGEPIKQYNRALDRALCSKYAKKGHKHCNGKGIEELSGGKDFSNYRDDPNMLLSERVLACDCVLRKLDRRL
jgi:hypothetical protein